MIDYKKIEQTVGIKFDDLDLLARAFTHRSYLNEHPKTKLEHNERLEFLGDAVLELVVTEHLYKNYQEPEGVLTNWRSALVKTESLADLAARLDLGQFLLMSKGENKSGGRRRTAILANTTEALIGAIYLDKGYDIVRDFIIKNIIANLPKILENQSHIDPKSHFQELAQEKDNITPSYKVISASGPDHDKHFVVGVFLNDKEYGRGKGPNKQTAQQAAAADALKRY
ncbi:MAG: ribonuclease III [bacterium]|nr:ribonuclease III [bacterium]